LHHRIENRPEVPLGQNYVRDFSCAGASQQITTLLYIKRACELNKSHIISTDEDPGLRIESFAVINLRGVSTNKTIYFIAMQTYKELISILLNDLTMKILSFPFSLRVKF
jgi:hypothetical protein